ncbi:MAG: dihydrodipicolinate synthase family protein [Clostridia bacterium]
MKKMFGVNTPISCPMTNDQQVDYASLARLCEFLIEKGVHGLYPNGSTGEMGYLSTEERKKVLECCVKTAAGRVQVFSMVGAMTTAETIELARHAQACGADGVGVVTPYYFKLDDEELLNHFAAVSASVSPDFSIYLYGIPQLAVNDITPLLAQRIAEKCPNVVGIKYSYPDMPRLMKFMNINDNTFSVLAGPDDLFYVTLCAGGDGTISGNSNVIPEHFVAIYDAFKAGNYVLAEKLQRKTNRMIDFISGPNNMARYKAALKHRGVIETDTLRSPLRPLSEKERADLLSAIERMQYTDVHAL